MPQSHRSSPLPHRISLERKLELLEARFTEPYDSDVATTLQSPANHHHHNTTTTTTTTHSFGFDTPMLGGHGTGSRSNLSTSLHEVHLAAARQMSKVAGATTPSDSRLEALSSSSSAASPGGASHTSSSHTLLTAHLTHTRPASHTALRVQESPPTTTNRATPDHTAAVRQRKRKAAAPVKVPEPSVTDHWGTGTTRKAADPEAPPTQGTATRRNMRAPEPTLETPGTLVGEAELSSHSPAQPSRESKKRNIFKRPTNNHLISNFFKPNQASRSKTGATGPEPGSKEWQNASHSAGSIMLPQGNSQSQPARSSRSPPTTNPHDTADDSQLRLLQQQCQDLEQALQETNDQLNAIRNHRSILHANLSVSLERCQTQLAAAKETHAQELLRLTRIVEESVRRQAEQEDSAVRERLAVNGVRLGQIVVQRVGMRTVEVWQDGQAHKTLQENKAKLRRERKVLEQRKEAAQRALEKILRGNCDTDACETETVGGLVIRNRLEATEALESVEYHLSDLSRRERELVREEQALNLEKAAHVRGLKRVNSEDNSRFRSRPKLHERYVLLSLLGKGGFSEVWRAYDLVDLCDVAVKIHQLDPRWSDSKKENYTKHISREYEIHKNVRHPRIVSLYDVFEIDNNSFATVLECCNGGDLDGLLKERKMLPERDARAILLQVLLGMQYLSQPSADGSRKGIIHYDLKPGNILFDENFDAKITDFGLSKIVDSTDSAESMELTSQGAGTYWYLPPECFMTDDNIRISSKVDVWSIGTIYYQMLFGKRPFGEGQSQDRILKDQTMLNAHHVTFPDHPTVTQEGKDFIRTCLAYEQAVRPNIAQVCELPYLYMDLK